MSDHASQEPFDYGMLDEQTREIVLCKTDETHGLIMRTAESMIAIGENLLAVQRYLPDMKFSAWLRAEFDLSRQSAYNNFCLAWHDFGTRSCFYPRPFAVEPIKTRFS